MRVMAIRLTIAQNRMRSRFALTSPLECRTLELFPIMEPRGNACASFATISKYPFGMFHVLPGVFGSNSTAAFNSIKVEETPPVLTHCVAQS